MEFTRCGVDASYALTGLVRNRPNSLDMPIKSLDATNRIYTRLGRPGRKSGPGSANTLVCEARISTNASVPIMDVKLTRIWRL